METNFEPYIYSVQFFSDFMSNDSIETVMMLEVLLFIFHLS